MKRGPYKKQPRLKNKVIYLRVTPKQHGEIMEWCKGRKVQTACLHQIIKAISRKEMPGV